MRRALAALLGTGLAVAGLACGTPEIPLYRVEERPFAWRIEAEGNLEGAAATPIAVPGSQDVPMRLAWALPDGSPVAAGEVVARFDRGELERQLAAGQADLAIAGHRRDQAEAGRSAERSGLELDREVAQTELDLARRFQTRDEQLFSRAEMAISALDAELAAAKLEHAGALEGIKQRQSGAGEELLAIEQAEAERAIRQAAQALDAVEVRAPHDGVLVLERSWRGETRRPGVMVWPGEKLGEIPDLDTLQAVVFVLEADAGALAVGQRAEVRPEAFPGTVWKAAVTHVGTVPRQRLRSSPVQFFTATLAFASPDRERMSPGQRVRATITLLEKERAVSVPRPALFDQGPRKIVYRRQGRRFAPVEVTVEALSPGWAVLATGLAPGDLVALRDPAESRAEPDRPGAAPRAPSAERNTP